MRAGLKGLVVIDCSQGSSLLLLISSLNIYFCSHLVGLDVASSSRHLETNVRPSVEAPKDFLHKWVVWPPDERDEGEKKRRRQEKDAKWLRDKKYSSFDVEESSFWRIWFWKTSCFFFRVYYLFESLRIALGRCCVRLTLIIPFSLDFLQEQIDRWRWVHSVCEEERHSSSAP